MKKADLVSAGLVTAFGLLLLFVVIPGWVEAHQEGGYGLGARVMPNVMATLLTALGALFFVARLVGRRDADDAPPPVSRANWIFLLTATLMVVALSVLFAWLGFPVAGPLTIAGFMILMGERRPVPVVATAVLGAGAIWLFFWQLLNFPLP